MQAVPLTFQEVLLQGLLGAPSQHSPVLVCGCPQVLRPASPPREGPVPAQAQQRMLTWQRPSACQNSHLLSPWIVRTALLHAAGCRRIGRTGRAGRTGAAITFFEEKDAGGAPPRNSVHLYFTPRRPAPRATLCP